MAVGIDIGGTKIAAALVDQDGQVLSDMNVPTPRDGYAEVLSRVAELIKTCVETADGPVTAVGVGSPGVVDPAEGVVRSATGILPGWTGAPIGSTLRASSGLPVAVENDVRAMAFAEALLGAGRSYDSVLYVAIGTGVGGAVTQQGRLVRGASGTVGEIAHLLVSTRGELTCGCGRHDHLEAVAAGPAIAATYSARRGGTAVPLTDLRQRMHAGDALAAQVVSEAGAILGRALAGLVVAAGFDAVVVGGGATALGDALMVPARQALLEEMERAVRYSVPMLAAELGTTGPLIGAGLIGLERASTEDPPRAASESMVARQ